MLKLMNSLHLNDSFCISNGDLNANIKVHQLAWIAIDAVVRVMQSSIAEDTFVNDWQREEFARCDLRLGYDS